MGDGAYNYAPLGLHSLQPLPTFVVEVAPMVVGKRVICKVVNGAGHFGSEFIDQSATNTFG
jgi:hypothetical protein